MNELIKRAAPGLALAGVALSTVWLFDPALHPDAASTAASTASDVSDSGSTDSGSTDSGSTDSGTTDSGTTDSGTSAGSDQSAAATSDCSTSEAVTGDAVMTQWGPVQVQMEFAADGSVCSVQAIAYPANDPKSASINARAIPYLDQQATQMGTSFDAVSGATYTSAAYRQSMQSILDQR
jgi:uncharacterized protein with FMN-binding domain